MKSLVLAIALVFMASMAFGASLVCDPQAGVTYYDVEVDGVVIPDVPAEGDTTLLFGVDYLPAGQHNFRARAYFEQGGWSSDWSDPYDATKPGSPGNVRVVN